ncbi:Rho termination factor N-terminal domain-containing protein [Ornithinibacillus sp. JPR2-1]|uniref:Rho termination factor N-terminal domain-containing protein n=1 Tax=Ornithinibacillus sp. JPR2-1 TaxID=2094019 RepID=UPI0031D69427
MVYKIQTPNPQYNGVTEGVAFAKGIGYTDDLNIRNVLINDYKYADISEVAEAIEVEAEKPIEDMTVAELKEKAKGLKLSGFSKLTRDELIALINGESTSEDDEGKQEEFTSKEANNEEKNIEEDDNDNQ